jgi:hypothetical protein
MRMLFASLGDTEMGQLAETLGQRGYPGGTKELAALARAWIGAIKWDDLEEQDIADLSDAQALSGIARKHKGGLDAFTASCGYPAGSRF